MCRGTSRAWTRRSQVSSRPMSSVGNRGSVMGGVSVLFVWAWRVIDFRERGVVPARGVSVHALESSGGLTLLGSRETTAGAHPIPLPRARLTKFLTIVDFPAFPGPSTINLGPASSSLSASPPPLRCGDFPRALRVRMARRASIRRRSSARWRLVRNGRVDDVDS